MPKVRPHLLSVPRTKSVGDLDFVAFLCLDHNFEMSHVTYAIATHYLF